MQDKTNWCDLVLEGGGVKGIGLVGAISILDGHSYKFHRIAGTSAGAIVASLVASGMPIDKLIDTMRTVDYHKFKDPTFLTRFGTPGELVSVLLEKGAYKGDYLRAWLGRQLDGLGVRTFHDLKITEDWATNLPPEQRYKLVVVVSDISHGRMVRLPWDYKLYGLNPAESCKCGRILEPLIIDRAHGCQQLIC